MPFATDTWAMVYNTELLAAAGVAGVPATWDELLEASRKIKARRPATRGSASRRALGQRRDLVPRQLLHVVGWRALVVEDANGGYTTGITAERLAEIIDYFKTYLDEGRPSRQPRHQHRNDPELWSA